MYKVLQQKLGAPPCALAKLLLIMKLTTLILIAAILQVSATTFAQKISLSVKDAPLTVVMDQIRTQTGYDFLYESVNLKNLKKVSIDAKNEELNEVLTRILKPQNLVFEIDDNSILIKSKPAQKSIIDKVVDFSVAITIRGKVVDENGNPLPGASVKAGNKTAITDANGEFSLNGVDEGSSVEISYLGYKTASFIASAQFISVQLTATLGQLNETVIKGYYSTTRELNTGNVGTVNSSVINNQPITNPLQALAGRVAGVQIIETNGLPGSPVTVQIRGRNSINAGNNPLYIVDGVPFSSTPIEFTPGPNVGPGAIGSPLNSISPSDIERIEVLKDADATAIYGSRGSNGVVLITTKKGSDGATALTANYNRGYGSSTRVPEVMGTADFLNFRRDAFTNAGVTPTAGNAPELFNYDKQADFHWPEWLIGNTTERNDATATLSGGKGQTNFLISGAYHDENSVRSESDIYRRSSFHSNVNHLSKNGKLSVNADVFYSGSHSKLQNGQLSYQNVYGAIPNYPVFNSLGDYNWIDGKTNFAAQAQSYNKTDIDNLNSYLRLSYKLFSDLDLRIGTGYNKISSDQIMVQLARSINPTSTTTLPNSRFATQYTRSFITEPLLSYSKKIALHQLEILIGGTYQNNKTRGNQFIINGYTSDNQQESVNFGTVTQKSDNIIDYKYLSVFGRAGYNWNSKYVLNTTFRRDGSSRFGAGRQFANFGSVAAAWVFSNEDFIKNWLTWLSYGKLRGSYGTTGNDGIPDYGYLSLYAPGLQYGAANTLLPSQVANENYRWEMNKKLEVALELGLLKNRILLTSAYYRNRSDNQLVGYPLPSTTGFDSYQANLSALVQNKGWEFEMNTTNVDTKFFTWTTVANLTIADNKLLKFPGIEKTSFASTYLEGNSLSIAYGYQLAQVNPDTGVPELVDQNKDGVFTRRPIYNGQNGDYVIMGQTNPKWFAGLNNTFNCKGFELNVLLQYTKQDGYNYIKYLGSFGLTNPFTIAADYWKQPGDQNKLPKPFAANNTPINNYGRSTATFGDASFLRVKNVALSYTIPGSLARFGVKHCKIYIQGQNLFSASDYEVIDPEQSGDSFTTIPPLKVYTMGLQVSF